MYEDGHAIPEHVHRVPLNSVRALDAVLDQGFGLLLDVALNLCNVVALGVALEDSLDDFYEDFCDGFEGQSGLEKATVLLQRALLGEILANVVQLAQDSVDGLSVRLLDAVAKRDDAGLAEVAFSFALKKFTELLESLLHQLLLGG